MSLSFTSLFSYEQFAHYFSVLNCNFHSLTKFIPCIRKHKHNHIHTHFTHPHNHSTKMPYAANYAHLVSIITPHAFDSIVFRLRNLSLAFSFHSIILLLLYSSHFQSNFVPPHVTCLHQPNSFRLNFKCEKIEFQKQMFRLDPILVYVYLVAFPSFSKIILVFHTSFRPHDHFY